MTNDALRPVLAGLVAVVIALALMAACTPDPPHTLGQPDTSMYECYRFMDHGRMFLACQTTELQRR